MNTDQRHFAKVLILPFYSRIMLYCPSSKIQRQVMAHGFLLIVNEISFATDMFKHVIDLVQYMDN